MDTQIAVWLTNLHIDSWSGFSFDDTFSDRALAHTVEPALTIAKIKAISRKAHADISHPAIPAILSEVTALRVNTFHPMELVRIDETCQDSFS
ncbi:hypothetical protein BLNAU_1376 [Blattamonas nauphoetae]|uniref:Uncharacterized protein n=1 Tax=Blattamonas nauphoetae TaxID=2049346 RepID=A0ABQ9Y0G5_9EUKA|nr:hypothetical protein BLNAU_19659 [Blattamonas nauphoetae]KAK2945511.1 hypothetical protein BLNAU_19584 [Blattamonas nauphoetae]KAK2957209.1 hypothetical protein BLNAU_7803 [Blattamonas nauphoetae]KAK2957775.1 hypothetical protein BLNAU_7209 [Blattamonas nauphoetae]KAK2963807.1 hypothetical protein BLNAU_1376 [Blattamonas nauphoetae]